MSYRELSCVRPIHSNMRQFGKTFFFRHWSTAKGLESWLVQGFLSRYLFETWRKFNLITDVYKIAIWIEKNLAYHLKPSCRQGKGAEPGDSNFEMIFSRNRRSTVDLIQWNYDIDIERSILGPEFWRCLVSKCTLKSHNHAAEMDAIALSLHFTHLFA